jgi:hypothetical protein
VCFYLETMFAMRDRQQGKAGHSASLTFSLGRPRANQRAERGKFKTCALISALAWDFSGLWVFTVLCVYADTRAPVVPGLPLLKIAVFAAIAPGEIFVRTPGDL